MQFVLCLHCISGMVVLQQPPDFKVCAAEEQVPSKVVAQAQEYEAQAQGHAQAQSQLVVHAHNLTAKAHAHANAQARTNAALSFMILVTYRRCLPPCNAQ